MYKLTFNPRSVVCKINSNNSCQKLLLGYSCIGRPVQTHTKINLPWDREGYGGFEYADEKLSARRIQWCAKKLYLLFWRVILKKIDEKWPEKNSTRTVRCASSKALIPRSQVLLRCLSLEENIFKKPSCCVLCKYQQKLVRRHVVWTSPTYLSLTLTLHLISTGDN